MTSWMPDLDELGCAPEGWKWRPGQRELAQAIADAPTKIVMVQAETGAGKSLCPIAAAIAAEKRSIILVQTRQLERQYLRDFPAIPMMEGRKHYDCDLTGGQADTGTCTVKRYETCNEAGCSGVDVVTDEECRDDAHRFHCPCPYAKARNEAAGAHISLHNYSYWLLSRQSTKYFAERPWIICDEAHELDRLMMDAAEFRMGRGFARSVGGQPPVKGASMLDWQDWSKNALALARSQADELDGDFHFSHMAPATTRQPEVQRAIKEFHQLKRLATGLVDLVNLDAPDEWVQQHDQSTYGFRPIFGKYGFREVRRSATDKVILMSAFLAPKMLKRTLGLTDDEVTLIEPETGFDRSKSPVLYLPVSRLSMTKTTESEWMTVIAVVDRLLDHFHDKKGLIHVPSYKLRDKVLHNSRHFDRLIVYNQGEKDAALETFRTTDRPQVLLGQSIATGVDLPYVPEFNIIIKLAFAPTNDPAVRKRMEVDPDFYPFLTICETVQATGRVKRAADHDGPTIILDANWGWFHASQEENFPAWFERAMAGVTAGGMPKESWKLFPKIHADLTKMRARAAATT